MSTMPPSGVQRNGLITFVDGSIRNSAKTLPFDETASAAEPIWF
jgi:hypothetical protein